jgi:two-component system, NarL family, captular synthesis response regulator RcsB
MAYRVIIADDHPVVLKGITLALANAGAGQVVGEATSPGELFTALGTTACDAVITDFSMPDPVDDGLAMLARLRDTYPALPLMVITTIGNPALYREILSMGVLGLLGKSGDAREIPEALRQIVSNHVYLGASVMAILGVEQGTVVGRAGTLTDLSPRELEVLSLFASGHSITQIARGTGRGLSTISQQKSNAMRKLRLASDAEIFEYIERLRR